MRALILLFLSFSLWAANGNEVGNGGDGIICGKEIELFDFYESKQHMRYKIKPFKGNWYEITSTRIKTLKKLAPHLYKQYSKVLEKIHDRLEFIPNANFRDVEDSYEVAVGKNCKLVQLAIQQDVEGERKVRISMDYWKQLSDSDKAGLILHEIIYEHFIALGEKNSIKVRHFNSLLSSERIHRFTKQEFNSLVRKLKIPIY